MLPLRSNAVVRGADPTIDFTRLERLLHSRVVYPPAVAEVAGAGAVVGEGTSRSNVEAVPSADSTLSSANDSKRQVVVGRFPSRRDFWRNHLDVAEGSFLMNVVDFGFRIPFYTIPTPYFAKNNRSAMHNAEFIDAEVARLLQHGCVVAVGLDRVTVVNPLTVSVNDAGKKRLVLDLRYVNVCIDSPSVKFDDARTAIDVILGADAQVAASFDLCQGYHHVQIYEPHRQYLGFVWRRQAYYFCVLPFGLSPAGYIFTKLLRTVVQFARKHGVLLVLYLDDGLIVAHTRAELLRATTVVRFALTSAGWIVNEQKSNWEAQRIITWLGLVFDLESRVLAVTTRRVEKALGIIAALLKCRRISARRLARYAGSVISMSIVLGSDAQFFTRYSCGFIADMSTWDGLAVMPPNVSNELRFWSEELSARNHCHIGAFLPRSADVVVYGDASATGYGVRVGGDLFSEGWAGDWSECEVGLGSTHREILVLKYGLENFRNLLTGKNVHWNTDNFAVSRIVLVGSMNPVLHRIALDIREFCTRQSVGMHVEWIPREENEDADSLSRAIDPDDWGVQDDIFWQAQRALGQFSVDLFASGYNAKCERFYSGFPSVTAVATDALRQDWTDEFAWICPPPRLLPQVIRKMLSTRMSGVLVLPWWRSSAFWPLITTSNGTAFIDAMVAVWVVPPGDSIFVPGSSRSSIFAKPFFASSVVLAYFVSNPLV